MKEEDIRPKDIFDKYLALAKQDVMTFFSNKDDFDHANCPACGNDRSTFQFDKEGFKYELCNVCGTLYVNPRPTSECIDNFYTQSESTKYWAQHFYKDTEAQRRERIFKPRAQMIRDFVQEEIGGKIDVFADVGAGYGVFCEEIKKLDIANKVLAIEPSSDLANICRDKKLDVIETSLEESRKSLHGTVSLATSFELFEHLQSPKDFLLGIYDILSENGYFIFTTLTINGFDLQILWDKSKSISPPHHINFFNLESAELLLERCGFRVVHKTTPGYLDVNIVKNMYEGGDVKLDRFIQHLIEKTDESTQENFQTFLRENNLSSHMCIIAQRD